MSIDKDLLDQLMEGHSPSDRFGKGGVLSERTKALAERALSTEIDEHLNEERSQEPSEGQNQSPQRQQPQDGDHQQRHRQRQGGSGYPA